ncbi:MAG: carboxypeptidase-like regulatory domain-containing protein, partial [Dyadobacter sp.]
MKRNITGNNMSLKGAIQKTTLMLLALLCSFGTYAKAPIEKNTTLKNSSDAKTADRTIKGKVTEKDKADGLPGVNVVIKGTSTGTTTDVTGAYTLSVPESGATLVFSFVGYVSQEVLVGNRSTIDVAIES